MKPASSSLQLPCLLLDERTLRRAIRVGVLHLTICLADKPVGPPEEIRTDATRSRSHDPLVALGQRKSA